jgi:hypothetical protein
MTFDGQVLRHRRRLGDRRRHRPAVRRGGGRAAWSTLDLGSGRGGSPPTRRQHRAGRRRRRRGASVERWSCDTVARLGRIDAVLNAAGHAEFGPLTSGRWSAGTA